ncbi:hypothetical protein lerEdw1_001741 [Lerista edwardsae]|nr:hypothetical protein lerEdw1_001741 [Lerista edwardsae]
MLQIQGLIQLTSYQRKQNVSGGVRFCK